MRLAFCVALLFFPLTVVGEQPLVTPLGKLVRASSNHNGKLVRTHGFITMSDEGTLLCEDLDRADAACVLVRFNQPWSEARKKYEQFQETEVLVTATFGANDIVKAPIQKTPQGLQVHVGLAFFLHELRSPSHIERR